MHVCECIWCCHSDLNSLFCFSNYVYDTCVIRSLEFNCNEPRTASIILVRSAGIGVWLIAAKLRNKSLHTALT